MESRESGDHDEQILHLFETRFIVFHGVNMCFESI